MSVPAELLDTLEDIARTADADIEEQLQHWWLAQDQDDEFIQQQEAQ
jgi:hypothetical protein